MSSCLPPLEGDVGLLLRKRIVSSSAAPASRACCCNRSRTRYIVVSLPLPRACRACNDLTLAHRTLIARIIDGLPWRVTPLTISSELTFCIDKTPGD